MKKARYRNWNLATLVTWKLVLVFMMTLTFATFFVKEAKAATEEISSVELTSSRGKPDSNSIYKPVLTTEEGGYKISVSDLTYDTNASHRGKATVTLTAKSGYEFNVSKWDKDDVTINCSDCDADFYKMKTATSSKVIFYIKYDLEVAPPEKAYWKNGDSTVGQWTKMLSSTSDKVHYQVKFRGTTRRADKNSIDLSSYVKKGSNRFEVRVAILGDKPMYSEWVESEELYSYSGSNTTDVSGSVCDGPGVGNQGISWYQSNGYWYCNVDGNQVRSNWVKDDGYWYYLLEDGRMAVGWTKLGGYWYFLSSATPYGHMLTGAQDIGGVWYFFEDTGVLRTNTSVNGCYVDSNGYSHWQ